MIIKRNTLDIFKQIIKINFIKSLKFEDIERSDKMLKFTPQHFE